MSVTRVATRSELAPRRPPSRLTTAVLTLTSSLLPSSLWQPSPSPTRQPRHRLLVEVRRLERWLRCSRRPPAPTDDWSKQPSPRTPPTTLVTPRPCHRLLVGVRLLERCLRCSRHPPAPADDWSKQSPSAASPATPFAARQHPQTTGANNLRRCRLFRLQPRLARRCIAFKASTPSTCGRKLHSRHSCEPPRLSRRPRQPADDWSKQLAATSDAASLRPHPRHLRLCIAFKASALAIPSARASF